MNRPERKCGHEKLLEELDRQAETSNARRERFRAGIERLLAPHRPDMEASGLRPGNSSREVPFYCEECRRTWPCPAFNDLRWLFGEVEEWAPAMRPYEPLVLRLAAAEGDKR